MEYFDVRDKDGRITGEIKERSLVHRDGDLHATVHIFIVREKEGCKEILLQKRAEDKDAYPGCYDISSAGHLSAGQDYMEGALRELEEELGIKASEEELHFIGYHEGYDENVFHDHIFRNHELAAVYLYTDEVKAEELTLQKEEVQSVAWFSAQDCLEKAAERDPGFCLFEDEILMVINAMNS